MACDDFACIIALRFPCIRVLCAKNSLSCSNVNIEKVYKLFLYKTINASKWIKTVNLQMRRYIGMTAILLLPFTRFMWLLLLKVRTGSSPSHQHTHGQNMAVWPERQPPASKCPLPISVKNKETDLSFPNSMKWDQMEEILSVNIAGCSKYLCIIHSRKKRQARSKYPNQPEHQCVLI